MLARNQDVTADTGTSWINVPNTVVDKITRATGAQYDFKNDMYLVDCSVTGLPNFVFTFGGKDYTLTQADYLLAVCKYCNGRNGGVGHGEIPGARLAEAFL